MNRFNFLSRDWLSRNRDSIIIILIMLLAVFLRFWHLNSLPPGLHPDEAANGLDIFRILEKHDLRPLYATNGPREALFFYLQALFVWSIGNTILALRIAPAIIGSLAVWVTFLWARSWFGSRVGLVTAFLMAITPWAITFSRNGFRAVMVTLMIPLVIWAYTKGFQTGRNLWFVIAGLAFGLGFYTYLAFRLFPLALVIIIVYLIIKRRGFLRKWQHQIVLSLIISAITLIPLGVYGVIHPGDLGARASGTSFLNKDLNNGRPVQALIDSTAKTLLMFNVHGDENYRHNLGGAPMLTAFIGIMMIAGFIHILFLKVHRPRYLALLVIFGVMLLPAILTVEGIPHALRAIGALPPVLIISAIGLVYFLETWEKTFPTNHAARLIGQAAIGMILVLTAVQNYNQYFVAWAQSPETFKAYSEDAVAMANFANSHAPKSEHYIIIDGYSDKTVQYLTHHKTVYRRLDPADIAGIELNGQPKEFLIALQAKDASIKQLQAKFPGGKLTPQFSTHSSSRLFYSYEITK